MVWMMNTHLQKHWPQQLNIFEYFSGRTVAYGLFESRFGSVRRSFVVEIDGRVQNDELILNESFIYDDGEHQRRIWIIVSDQKGGYQGRADDVIDEAVGHVIGNCLNWRYEMLLSVKNRKFKVSFDDWMYLMPDNVLFNRADLSKLGVTIGSVSISFHKPVGSRFVG